MSELASSSQSEFFLVCLPGFESLTQSELNMWHPAASGQVERGGVTVQLPLADGLALNRVLKTPSRILVRLAKFGCRDFPKLFRKLSSFAWNEWVSDGVPLEFQASSHKSWLRIKRRIEETADEAYAASLKKRGLTLRSDSAGEPIKVLIRIDDNVCTLSLDTSGEMLHKRGYRPMSSEAPLRETMASALLLLLEQAAPVNENATVQLVDPMTGGGTFLLEAAGLRKPVTTRGFAFEANPALAHQTTDTPLSESRSRDPYSSFVGFDSDEKAIRSARENWQRTGEKRALDLLAQDFLNADPLAPGVDRWLIVNPPYGERIRVEGRLQDYYQNLFLAAERVVGPERALFLLPEKVRPKILKLPSTWKLLTDLPFSNGGLPVRAMVYGRKS